MRSNSSSLLLHNSSDPRNRADTVCNVTVLGIPTTATAAAPVSSSSSSSEKQHLIVLAMIHDWTAPTTATTNNNSSSEASFGPHGQQLAWMSFTFETAREQKLAEGSQLRIYNAISIPIVVAASGANHQDDDDANTAAQVVKWMVVCTQLCEPYPAHVLPALPVVGDSAAGVL